MGQQVTALTAEKSLELANENIVGAVISGGRLILRRRNWDPATPTAAGTYIDAGSVIGPTGPSGGSKLAVLDNAGGADDPLNGGGTTATVADTWYTIASVSANTGALVVGHKYAVDYYAPLLHPEDLNSWDGDLLDGATAVHRANAFAPNGGRTSVAQGTYYFVASSTTAKTFTMRARATVGTTSPAFASVDNSFASATIAIVDYVP